MAPRVGQPGAFVPQLDVTGFKCSPKTYRCTCAGKADCAYMKDLIQSCGTHTCTGSGESQKCCCVIGGQSTCQP